MSDATYQLYYWPGLPGRGEYVRLLLEDAGLAYRDVARLPEAEGGGIQAVVSLRAGTPGAVRPWAPPAIKVGDQVIAQTAAILDFIAVRHDLISPDLRTAALQHQLTIADLVMEVHDTHHPIAIGLRYEDQRDAAKQRAAAFLSERMPRLLAYFESLTDGPHLVGGKHSYVDLSMFHTLEGIDHAFPNGFANVRADVPNLQALRARVKARPGIAAYLSSERRAPFNEDGIFRRYPELDSPGPPP